MENEKINMLLEAAPEAVILVDAQGIITFVNRQCEKYFDYRRDELVGQSVEILVPDELRAIHVKHRQKYIINPSTRPMGSGLNLKARRKDGSVFPVNISLSPLQDKEGLIITAIIHDITAYKQSEEKLKWLAEHDELTGLINRSLFHDRVSQAIKRAIRHQDLIAIFFLDLDGFKKINDTYGHTAGDLLLCASVKRIQKCIRDLDSLARIGGDEFALLLTEIKKENTIIAMAKKILGCFTEDFLISNKKLNVTVSIGISLYPKDGDDYQSLLEKSDRAMYYVKKHGKNNFQMFDRMITDNDMKNRS